MRQDLLGSMSGVPIFFEVYSACLYLYVSNCSYVCVCVSHSVMSDSSMLWTVACQAPLSMEFSRQQGVNG